MSNTHILVSRFSKTANGYWRFNVALLNDVDDESITMLGWSISPSGKLCPPFARLDKGCYTMARVSRKIAFNIFGQAATKIAELDPDFFIPEEGWKSAIIGESTFQKSFPDHYETYVKHNRARKSKRFTPITEVPTSGFTEV